MTASSHQPSGRPALPTSFGEIADTERWAHYVEVARDSGAYVSHEPLEGPAFSIQTRSSHGMHHVLSISPRQAPDGRHDVAAPASEEEAVVLRSVARGILDLAGHESGEARTEVVLLPHGPRITALWLEPPARGAR